ncbi:TIGR03899 family protein [Alkalimonas delamerensis]|uniref:TIGR03899 family protein n=1 Tax=Alkalimonas delamerensis TaxID=265981 RepID=A0ABT9GLC9_9GAMM|nr:TIGR03899 family protein [Alkalimonas delamerensis]MDP4527777.1 TIGR03899 family protein [Alkalimonas delamerensis]
MTKLTVPKASTEPASVRPVPVKASPPPAGTKTPKGNKVKRSPRFYTKFKRLSTYAGVQLSQQSGLDQLPLTQRLQRRLRMQQERQQLNLERIIALSADYAPEHVSEREVDPDWFHHYCELALNIANPGMQQLWAKILACEIATPGQFSLKTLYVLKKMSHKEALALQQAASLSCRSSVEGSGRIYFAVLRRPSLLRLITGRGKAMLNLSQYRLSYPDILSLMDTGLLHHEEIESGELSKGDSIQLTIQQQRLQCTAIQSGLVLHYYKFSPLGDELLPLLTLQPQPLYLEALQQLLSPFFVVKRLQQAEADTNASD